MKAVFLLCALAVVVSARPDGTYTDKYDNVNLDEILGNKRLMKPYIECMLDKGKCAPDAKELKSHIKEGLENNCAKCTPKQNVESRRVIGYLINNEPEYWTELSAKYDPEGKYTHKYESELRTVTA